MSTMLKRNLLSCIAILAVTANAEIILWSGEADDVDIVQETGVVTIEAAGTFKFESVTGGVLDDEINLIQIASGVTGTVTVFVERSTDNDTPGASDIGEINLTNNAGVIGVLQELRITGDLGANGPTVVNDVGSGDLAAASVSDDIIIEDDLPSTALLDVGTMTGDIEVRDMFSGKIRATSLTGDIRITRIGTTILPGDIEITSLYSGTITASPPLDGSYDFNGGLNGAFITQRDMAGKLTITGNMGATAQIVIGEDLRTPGAIEITGNVARNSSVSAPYEIPSIHVKGIIDASSTLITPSIEIGGELSGVVAVNGAVENANTNSTPSLAAEIQVGSLGTFGAIAVNYDGIDADRTAFTDTLLGGANIRVGSTDYTSNSPGDDVYIVPDCLGDMNGDDSVDSSDGTTSTGPYADARDDPETYVENFPGLGGSRVVRGDCERDGTFSADDNDAFDTLSGNGCCIAYDGQTDADYDFDVDLDDLLFVLGSFGATVPLGQDGDVNFNGVVNLDDLLLLLGQFGTTICPDSLPVLGGGSVALSVDAFDTGGYTGGGFAGEDEHFVFDGLIEMSDPNDDWLLSLVCAASTNGAVFRLVDDPNDPLTPGNTLPEKYSTFFSAPYAVNAAGRFTAPLSGGGIAGACGPEDPDLVYTATELDAGWYDTAANSHDGPAAVFRIVLDVSGVSGADTSGGLGSVYFSTTGPADPGHIEVASLHTRTGRKFAGTSMTALTGAFYVMD